MAVQSLAARVKTNPALLAKALKNPGLRSKLPDQYLSPGQRAARARNAALASLGDINTPLSGPAMVNAANQIVNSDFNPLLAGIDKQEGKINKSTTDQRGYTKSYYDAMNSLLDGIVGHQATANTDSVSAANARGQATQQAITDAATGAQGRMNQDAAIRGPGLEGSAPATLAAQTAAASQAASGDAARAATSAQQFGDVTSAFMRGLQGVSVQQGGEAQNAITTAQNNALTQLGQQRADLNAKRPGALTDALLKIRGTEQQNAITAAGLGIKTDAAGAAATNAAGAEGRKYGYSPTEWLKLPASVRTGIVAAANKKTPSDQGYGPGRVGMNKYGYTYAEWTKLSPTEQAKARAGKGKGQGKGSSNDPFDATKGQIGDAQTAASTAIADAKAAGIPIDAAHRHQLASFLLASHPEGAATVTQKTKDGSVSRKVIQRPAMDAHDPLFTSVALDVLIDGHVSRYNAGRLHARGITVEDLGYPSYADYKKNHPGGGAADYPNKGGRGAGG